MKLTLENVACKKEKKSYSLVVVVDIKANKCEEIRIGHQTWPATMRTRGRTESIDLSKFLATNRWISSPTSKLETTALSIMCSR